MQGDAALPFLCDIFAPDRTYGKSDRTERTGNLIRLPVRPVWSKKSTVVVHFHHRLLLEQPVSTCFHMLRRAGDERTTSWPYERPDSI